MQENTNHEKILINKLFEAIELGKFDDVKALIVQIKNFDIRNQYGNTPLYEAVYGNHIDIVIFLLSIGVDPNISGHRERTPLLLAVIRGNIPIVKLLLQQSVNIECKNEKSQTPLAVACFNYKLVSIVDLLLEVGANKEAQDDHGKTPLHHAAETDNLEALMLLIEHKVNLCAQDNYQRTPLHYAAQKNADKVILCLLAFGADLEAQDNKGRTPFHLAKRDGAKKSIRVLKFHGANQDAKDEEGYKPGVVGVRHRIVRRTKKKQSANKNTKTESLAELGLFKLKLEENNSTEDITTLYFSQRTLKYLVNQAILLNKDAIELYKASAYKKSTRKFKLALELIELVNQDTLYFDFKVIHEDENNSDDLKNIYFNIGSAYKNYRDYKNATKYYQKAFDLNTKLYGENHTYSLKARELLQECFQLLENKVAKIGSKP